MGTLKKKQICSEEDWKQANQLERIFIWIVDSNKFELNNQDEQKYVLLRKIWGILGQTLNKARQVELICDRCGIEEREAYRLIKQAEEIFGKLSEVDEWIEFQSLKQRYYLMADLAEKEGDYETARRCLDSARQIMEQQNAKKPREARVYAQVVFVDNPKAITSQADADDIDYEEIEDGVLEPEATRFSAGPATD